MATHRWLSVRLACGSCASLQSHTVSLSSMTVNDIFIFIIFSDGITVDIRDIYSYWSTVVQMLFPVCSALYSRFIWYGESGKITDNTSVQGYCATEI